MAQKLTFYEALERLCDDRQVDRKAVQARALQRKVWIAEWHIPGCLSESRAILTRKVDAIEAAVEFTGADGSSAINHYCPGIREALRRNGQYQHHTELYGNVITTIERLTLGDLL
jgi:hypothetical protein